MQYKTKVMWADIGDEDKWDVLRKLCDHFGLDQGEARKALLRIDHTRKVDNKGGADEAEKKDS